MMNTKKTPVIGAVIMVSGTRLWVHCDPAWPLSHLFAYLSNNLICGTERAASDLVKLIHAHDLQSKTHNTLMINL